MIPQLGFSVPLAYLMCLYHLASRLSAKCLLLKPKKKTANLSPLVALVPLAYLFGLSHLAVQLPDRFGRPVRPAASTAHAIFLQMM